MKLMHHNAAFCTPYFSLHFIYCTWVWLDYIHVYYMIWLYSMQNKSCHFTAVHITITNLNLQNVTSAHVTPHSRFCPKIGKRHQLGQSGWLSNTTLFPTNHLTGTRLHFSAVSMNGKANWTLIRGGHRKTDALYYSLLKLKWTPPSQG